ncbi:MAG TPA: DUF1549 and DUF1553 domain-containing protein, partial [Gemmataceae bacterium]
PEKTRHWAWQKPQRPAVPEVRDGGWVRNPIDAFILARLEAAGLRPAPPAGRAQLLRRATFDLTGLPPTPEEIDDFLGDDSPGAYERVVERLLASPAYGERWGRHWLDLARFAETNGYEHDELRPDAWRYRDYVIRSFNADKPYDRFVREQLAGDELYPGTPEALIATGFNLLGPDMTDAASQAQRRQNTLDDMTDTAGLVFLGLTLGCARCHDHKFEPIPQTDFYRMQAFFAPAEFRNDLPIAREAERTAHERAARKYEALTEPVRDALAALEAPYRAALREAKFAKLADDAKRAHRAPPEKRTAGQKELVQKTSRLLNVSAKEILAALKPEDKQRRRELEKELKELERFKPPPLPTAMGLRDGKGPAKTFLLRRGELGQPGEEVLPGWPVVLSPDFREVPAVIRPPAPGTTGRRAALAGWVASADNPLTARVMVNRLWQHHFGRGIVGTPSDFGVRGERPTHPELLDWLATEFVRSGWSIKHMHRLMLLSGTYRQASLPGAGALAADPANERFGRMNRRRLEGEIVRDALLAAAGRLNREMGGPGVFPPLPEEIDAGPKAWKTSPDARDHVRRSVYIFARRNLRFPFLEVFDFPDSNLSCPKRERSTTAPQALALLNSADVAAAADALAARVGREAGDVGERVALAYRLALGRAPTAEEAELAREFLGHSPLRELCRALFNLNEFVYID